MLALYARLHRHTAFLDSIRSRHFSLVPVEKRRGGEGEVEGEGRGRGKGTGGWWWWWWVLWVCVCVQGQGLGVGVEEGRKWSAKNSLSLSVVIFAGIF